MARKEAGTSGETSQALVGWQGIRFCVPSDWNVTGFSMDRENGYLKVDSPSSMFVQVKWTDPGKRKVRTLGDVVYRWWVARKKTSDAPAGTPDLRAMLDTFLKETGKRARKAKTPFDCKVKPETTESGGERVAHHFSWSGGGQGQGKVWYCRSCRRVVIAQVVGQARDPVGDVASVVFGSMRDHDEDGWTTWALYDMVSAVPSTFALKSQKLMSGYLRLDFERRGGERIAIERWGLASVTRRKFTLKEWLLQVCDAARFRPAITEVMVAEHDGVKAVGRARLLDLVRVVRESVTTRKLAVFYEACAWECRDTNKLYAVQVWRNKASAGLLEEVTPRCECH